MGTSAGCMAGLFFHWVPPNFKVPASLFVELIGGGFGSSKSSSSGPLLLPLPLLPTPPSLPPPLQPQLQPVPPLLSDDLIPRVGEEERSTLQTCISVAAATVSRKLAVGDFEEAESRWLGLQGMVTLSTGGTDTSHFLHD